MCAGPCRELVEYREKYSGIDKPRNSETPIMNRLRIEFMLVNCIKESPTAADDKTNEKPGYTVRSRKLKQGISLCLI